MKTLLFIFFVILVLLTAVQAFAGCQVIVLPDGRMVTYCCYPGGNCTMQ